MQNCLKCWSITDVALSILSTFISPAWRCSRSEYVTFTSPKQNFPVWTQTSNSPATVLTLCPLGHSSCWNSLFSPGCSCSEPLVGPLSQNFKPLWQLLATESSRPAWVIEDHHMCDPTELELCSHCLLLSFDHDLSPCVLCRPCLLTHGAEKWGWDNVKIFWCCILDIAE